LTLARQFRLLLQPTFGSGFAVSIVNLLVDDTTMIVHAFRACAKEIEISDRDDLVRAQSLALQIRDNLFFLCGGRPRLAEVLLPR
jgi:hypothetical protein